MSTSVVSVATNLKLYKKCPTLHWKSALHAVNPLCKKKYLQQVFGSRAMAGMKLILNLVTRRIWRAIAVSHQAAVVPLNNSISDNQTGIDYAQ
jgi:hypothetical protein